MLIKQWLLSVREFFPLFPFENAQTFPLTKTTMVSAVVLSQAMPCFASKVLAGYREEDQDKLLVIKMRLQVAAGNYRDAR